jgi:hypothetical protein
MWMYASSSINQPAVGCCVEPVRSVTSSSYQCTSHRQHVRGFVMLVIMLAHHILFKFNNPQSHCTIVTIQQNITSCSTCWLGLQASAVQFSEQRLRLHVARWLQV